MINLTVQEMKDMFNRINVDCEKTSEAVVPLTDTEYYAEQITNIFEVDDAEAQRWANLITE